MALKLVSASYSGRVEKGQRSGYKPRKCIFASGIHSVNEYTFGNTQVTP